MQHLLPSTSAPAKSLTTHRTDNSVVENASAPTWATFLSNLPVLLVMQLRERSLVQAFNLDVPVVTDAPISYNRPSFYHPEARKYLTNKGLLESVLHFKEKYFGPTSVEVAATHLYLGRLAFWHEAHYFNISGLHLLEEGQEHYRVARNIIALGGPWDDVESLIPNLRATVEEYALENAARDSDQRHLEEAALASFLLSLEEATTLRLAPRCDNARAVREAGLHDIAKVTPSYLAAHAKAHIEQAEDILRDLSMETESIFFRLSGASVSYSGVLRLSDPYSTAASTYSDDAEKQATQRQSILSFNESYTKNIAAFDQALQAALSFYERAPHLYARELAWSKFLQGISHLHQCESQLALSEITSALVDPAFAEMKTKAGRYILRLNGLALRAAGLDCDDYATWCLVISKEIAAGVFGESSYSYADANMRLGHHQRNLSGFTALQLSHIFGYDKDSILDLELLQDAKRSFTEAAALFKQNAIGVSKDIAAYNCEHCEIELHRIQEFLDWVAHKAP